MLGRAKRADKRYHVQTPGDIERMGRLGIIASFQPTHGAYPTPSRLDIHPDCAEPLPRCFAATSDMAYAETRLGPERIKGAYAWRSLLKCVCRSVLAARAQARLLRLTVVRGAEH